MYIYPDVSVLIFTRAPEKGKCKTRLIPYIGEEAAAQLQHNLICKTVAKLCEKNSFVCQLWCTPSYSNDCFLALTKKYNLILHKQEGDNLGERMLHALEQQTNRYAIIVGTDIPLLSLEYIESAILKLQEGNDAVIGPAEDGGYVLLGVNQVNPTIFKDIHWGTNQVYEQTCNRLNQTNMRWTSIDCLWDLDDINDFKRYQNEII